MDTPTPDLLIFGPVPSRRLGRSLGINNIPPKECTYACVYCQVGPTTARPIERRPFYDPQLLVESATTRVEELRSHGERIDYLTFVPDGEPTLDINLAEEIEGLRPLGIPIAVITNASLIWRTDVRDALALADWVSVKVDAVDEDLWRRVNRPNPHLRLADILSGIQAFDFAGFLATETMLVDGLNDSAASVKDTATFIGSLPVSTAYISVPTRPTTLAHATIPSDEAIVRAYHLFSERVPKVELLTGYEGDEFAASGDTRSDLLGITAVHPMRRSAVQELLDRNGSDWDEVQALLDAGELRRIEYLGEEFYARRPAHH